MAISFSSFAQSQVEASRRQADLVASLFMEVEVADGGGTTEVSEVLMEDKGKEIATPQQKPRGKLYDEVITQIDLNDEWFAEDKNFRWARQLPYQDFSQDLFDEHIINQGLPIVLTGTLSAWDPSQASDEFFSLKWLRQHHGYHLFSPFHFNNFNCT